MADRFCPNCGTEVDADARFCPSCGTTLSGPEQDSPIPAAPAWPPSEPPAAAEPPSPADEPAITAEPASAEDPPPADAAERELLFDEPTAAVRESDPLPPPPLAAQLQPSNWVAPPASASASAAAQAPETSASPGGQSAELPFSWPTLLSGWLIGIGSVVGAVALIPRLAGAGYLLSMLLFLALLGIAATIFLADQLPAIPRLRLIVLGTTLIGLGVGLARAAFAIQGIDTVFLIAMLAAAGGAVLIELDRDRPFPPPERSGS
jgi:hypothetical protein